jgi:hypothetical protein
VSRRRVVVSLLLIVVTMMAGLTIRFAHVGLPVFMVKYGGSALWAMMIYWIVSSVLGTWSVKSAALVAGCVATAVEFFKLYHAPALDGFRHTIAGALLLGRIFSFRDIAVYWIAIAIAAGVDVAIRRNQ